MSHSDDQRLLFPSLNQIHNVENLGNFPYRIGVIDSKDVSLSNLGDSGQRSLACCHSWGHKESDMTEQLNNSKVSL